MKLERFELERIQSENENEVDINLSESGVEPMSVQELIAGNLDAEELLQTRLGYPQTNGTPLLREEIAAIYDGASADTVFVTNGGAEANFLTVWSILHENPERKEVVMMQPNYMQIHGITAASGGEVRPFWVRVRDGRWAPDIEELKKLVSRKTAAVAVCNPNNPTGAILTAEEMRAIAEIADDAEAWVISDEVYQGAEMTGGKTPSMFGLSERVIVTNSLSKAYGLPGLRLGWAVTHSREHAELLWSYSDYVTISPTMLSDMLATIALQPLMRAKILRRTRNIVTKHWAIMKQWLDAHEDIFDYVAPQAASICFPKHNLEASSSDFVARLLREKSVLLIPGEHFGFPHYFRFGFGHSIPKLKMGLKRIDELLATLH